MSRAADFFGLIGTGKHDPIPVLMTGIWVVILGFAGFMAWAGFTSLARGAHVVGRVAVESSRKLVQHREGGLVKELLVREGQFVKQGEPVVILDDTAAKANLEGLEQKLARDLMAKARLEAELEVRGKVDFPILDQFDLKEKYNALLKDQTGIFLQRRLRLQEQVAQAEARIAQLGPQMASNASDIEAMSRTLAILEQRIAALEPLVRDGLYPRNQFLDQDSLRIRATSELAARRQETARLSETVVESQQSKAAILAQYRQDAAEQLNDARARIADAFEQRKIMRDVLARTRILAPVDGQVMNLMAHTVGGVIGPGQPIMTIVPTAERLIVEADVSPLDIDVVHAGMPAEVRFSSLPRRTSPLLKGKLLSISRDVVDLGSAPQAQAKQGMPTTFYLARIEVFKEELAKIHGVEITPGMPIEVLLDAGERSVLEYLIAPWVDLFSKAMRED